jgi:Putative zinc-finger
MTPPDEYRLSRSSCPVDQLQWLVNGTLSPQECSAVEAHLTGCASCQAEVRVWTELRQALQGVGAQTPEPRADLFPLIEQRLDLLPSPVPWFGLPRLLQVCWLVLSVIGEHLFAQVRLIRRDLFWMPFFIVPLVVVMVSLPRPWSQAVNTAALLAALLTALSMAFLYGQQVDPAREIAMVTRTSPRLVLGVRCGVVFGYDLLLNCGLVLPLLVLHGTVTPAWFLVNWLAPLCCLSAIALLLGILVNASTAVFVCILLWALRLLGSVQALLLGGEPPLSETFWQQHYEGFWHQGLLLFVVALLAVLLAFSLVERKERFAR